jgi:ribonuclease HII
MAKRSLANRHYRDKRTKELFMPIERCIMMTDDPAELILLASIMIQVAKDILIRQLGIEKAIEFVNNLEMKEK